MTNERSLIFILQNISQLLSYKFLPQNNSNLNINKLSLVANAVLAPEDVPHHVLVVYGSRYCSGSLSSSKIVLTVASCFSKHSKESVYVKAGSSTIPDFGQVIPVIEIKTHEYYRYLSKLDNDIALLMLKEHVKFNDKVKKIALVPPEIALRDSTPVKVLGWGSANIETKFMNNIVQATMTVINKNDCFNFYGKYITPSNFCVIYLKENRISDNGGSVTYDNMLVGVVSAAATTERPPHVAIITNVSYFHKWIVMNTKSLLKKYCEDRKEYNKILLLDEVKYYY